MAKTSKHANNTEAVNEFMDKLDHPLEAEVQTVREIIKCVDPGITEQVKWNAPSFSYNEDYLATFNLHVKKHVHLVFHNPAIVKVESGLLEGDYKDRRMAYFSDREDVENKKQDLEKVVKELIRLIDKEP